jgi:hypothetical protein
MSEGSTSTQPAAACDAGHERHHQSAELTNAFVDIAPPPKYPLTMLGAGHIGPYTDQQPQLGIVERVTIAFLDRYLKGERAALSRMLAAGEVRGTSFVRPYP